MSAQRTIFGVDLRLISKVMSQRGVADSASALPDELVGVAVLETGDHVVRFCDLDLGLINRRGLFTRFAALREGRSEPGDQAAQTKLSGIMPVQNVDNHSG